MQNSRNVREDLPGRFSFPGGQQKGYGHFRPDTEVHGGKMSQGRAKVSK